MRRFLRTASKNSKRAGRKSKITAGKKRKKKKKKERRRDMEKTKKGTECITTGRILGEGQE